MLRRIDHVGIVVGDLQAHVEQLEALGLRLDRTHTNEGQSHAVYYPSGDASVELIELLDPAGRAERLPDGEAARIEHIAFEVDSLEEVRDVLEARGVEVTWPPFPSSGNSMMIWTNAETSGGVQYQFLVRPKEGGG